MELASQQGRCLPDDAEFASQLFELQLSCLQQHTSDPAAGTLTLAVVLFAGLCGPEPLIPSDDAAGQQAFLQGAYLYDNLADVAQAYLFVCPGHPGILLHALSYDI